MFKRQAGNLVRCGSRLQLKTKNGVFLVPYDKRFSIKNGKRSSQDDKHGRTTFFRNLVQDISRIFTSRDKHTHRHRFCRKNRWEWNKTARTVGYSTVTARERYDDANYLN